MRMKASKDALPIQTISYLVLTITTMICLLPFMIIIMSSFTDELEIIQKGYTLFPSRWSIEAYKMILRVPEKIVRSYGITIFITIVGTIIGMFLTSMAAYVLNRKDFKYRNKLSFYLYFTTLFSGGLVPYYILMVKSLGLRDNLLAIILPNLVSVWSILLFRNFLRSVPDSLYESARIDGSGDFAIYIKIIMPLSTPAIATIGLFQALAYWNEWYNSMLFLQKQELFPLQLFLKNMLSSTNIAALVKSGVTISRDMIPTEGMKMAMAVVAIGPVVLFYPFVQKHFVSGIMLGAVKG